MTSLSFPLAISADKSPAYSGPNLLQIAMPMGGIGSGCICLNGHGGLQDYALHHKPAATAHADQHVGDESAFAMLHVKAEKGRQAITKLLEGPLPVEKIYNQSLGSGGYRHGFYEGLPRLQSNTFTSRYPFGVVDFEDPRLPLKVSLTGWSPFIPRDDVNSSLPCAISEYTVTNSSDTPVQYEFSYHLQHLAVPHRVHWDQTRNHVISSEWGGGIFLPNTAPNGSEEYGSASLFLVGHNPKIKAEWFRGDWFDSIGMLWQETSTGSFRENTGDGGEASSGRNGASLLVEGSLAPGESAAYPILITWHFPNSNLQVGGVTPSSAEPSNDETNVPQPAWAPYYTSRWDDAKQVALYVAQHYSSLRRRTEAFADALHSSTLPAEVIDAVSSNLAILKSPTVLRQKNGNVWAWEGCGSDVGSCYGTCTHVWNYAQAMPHLFPKLERTLREQELVRSMNEEGHVSFRSALPDGPTHHGYHAASDGQLGGILKLCRDWHISGDTEWMQSLYPLAKRSLDYCINLWDPQHKGGLFEPHHNTYDIEFWGPDGMCGSVYVGALCALAEMAKALGQTQDEKTYGALAQTAARFVDETLFNGEYYQQHVQWEGLRDTSFTALLSSGTLDTVTQALYELEGPKYQYGSGCLSDGIIGGWMAKIYGIDTPLSSDHVRSTLQSIFRYNFRDDLFDHPSLQRPGYAIGHEAGLLLCTWPRGEKLTLPFPYSDEVWTGIEYQVASHLMEEGMVEEGLKIVRAARSRYEGHVRNPFNEYECGGYYARALASYALLGSLSGFRYSAVDKALWLGPKINSDAFQTFFSAASGYGVIALEGSRLTITVQEGMLEVKTLHVTVGGVEHTLAWDVIVQPGSPAYKEIVEKQV